MTSTLPVGNPDQIQATYSGDVNFQTNSGSSGYMVGTATTTTALSAVPDQSMGSSYLLLVTFTATVTGQFGGNPTGIVEFTENGADIPGCAKVAVATQQNGGVAICGTTSLPVGSDKIVATYSGDKNFSGGPSAPIQYPVSMATTTVSPFTSSQNPSSYLQAVTFAATVMGANRRHTHRDFDLYQ